MRRHAAGLDEKLVFVLLHLKTFASRLILLIQRLLDGLSFDRWHLQNILLHLLDLLHLVLRRDIASTFAVLASVAPKLITLNGNLRLDEATPIGKHVLNLAGTDLHILGVDLLHLLVSVDGLGITLVRHVADDVVVVHLHLGVRRQHWHGQLLFQLVVSGVH